MTGPERLDAAFAGRYAIERDSPWLAPLRAYPPYEALMRPVR